MTAPTPQTWTLRLKSHRTTILLHIDPLQTFPSIKRTLLTVLQETDLRASEHGPSLTLPSSASSIQFGRAVDPLDAAQGFELGAWEADTDLSNAESDAEAENESVGKKGKGVAKGKAAKEKERDEPGNCPKGAGLRDGAVLAFRWEGDGLEREKGWGVKIASFEDAYGVANEGDLGGRGEFEG